MREKISLAYGQVYCAGGVLVGEVRDIIEAWNTAEDVVDEVAVGDDDDEVAVEDVVEEDVAVAERIVLYIYLVDAEGDVSMHHAFDVFAVVYCEASWAPISCDLQSDIKWAIVPSSRAQGGRESSPS